MKKLIITVVLLLVLLSACSEELASSAVSAAADTAEKAIKTLIESIDWEELQVKLAEGKDALLEKYPALRQENINKFLKENGLKLLNKYLQSRDAETQENAAKLGAIISILYPELSDEVDAALNSVAAETVTETAAEPAPVG